MAVHLLQLNREIHAEIMSVLEGSLTLDVHHVGNDFLQQTDRYQFPNYVRPVTLTPSTQHRLGGLVGLRITPGVYSEPSTYSILCGPLGAPAGASPICTPVLLNLLSVYAVGRPLKLGLEVNVCTWFHLFGGGNSGEVPEFSREEVDIVMQEHAIDLEQYCALYWEHDLWQKLLDFISQGVIREVAVCFVSANGFFGELIKLHGVGHVLGLTFEANEHRARLEVVLEFDEEHLVEACESKSVGRHLHHGDLTEETLVRLKMRKGPTVSKE